MMRDIVKEISPTAIWQRIAAAQHKYLLIGDGDHADVGVKEGLLAALPMLAGNGFRHLGLEQDRKREQRPIDAFQFASARARKNERDVDKLLTYITSSGQKCLIPDKEKLFAEQLALCELLMTARDKDVRVHCMNKMLSFTKFLKTIDVHKAKKFGQYGEYAFVHRAFPPRLSSVDMRKLDTLMGLYQDDYNGSLDKGRARDLKRLSGKSRAVLLFGAWHFRRNDGQSIDAHLPPDSTAFVYMGTAARVAARLEASHEAGGHKLPDFAIETDTKRGLMLFPARSNGFS